MKPGDEKSTEIGLDWDRNPQCPFMGSLDGEIRKLLVQAESSSYILINYVEGRAWNPGLRSAIHIQFNSLLRGFVAWEGL